MDSIEERYKKYIRNGCEELGLSDWVKNRVEEIIFDMQSTTRSGQSPRVLSAGATYLVCNAKGENRTQERISEAFRVAEVSVRNGYKKIVECWN